MYVSFCFNRHYKRSLFILYDGLKKLRFELAFLLTKKIFTCVICSKLRTEG